MSLHSAGRLLARVALGLAVVAALAIAFAGPGTRLGVWDFRRAFLVMRWGSYGALAASALGLIGAVIGGARGLSAAALVIGLLSFAGPYMQLRIARSVPPIHDISTDTVDPPKFVAVMPRRAGALNTADYGGEPIASQQHKAYPDVTPLHVPAAPAQAFDRALAAARGMGWEIVDAAADQGRIEATATTFWFGFKDDVVVRVRPDTSGSIVDVRSLSRVGRSDLGANAKRIRAYLDRLRSNG